VQLPLENILVQESESTLNTQSEPWEQLSPSCIVSQNFYGCNEGEIQAVLQSVGVLSVSDKIINTIKEQRYAELADLIHPKKKLVLYYEGHSGVYFTKEELQNILEKDQLGEIYVNGDGRVVIYADNLLELIADVLQDDYKTRHSIASLDSYICGKDDQDLTCYTHARLVYSIRNRMFVLDLYKNSEGKWALWKIGYSGPMPRK